MADMDHQSECAEDRGNVTETEKECAEAASPPREEMFAATQALQDEELELEEEKRAFAEKKKTEQRSRKIDNHPIAKLLQELIPFADQGLAPLPRVIEEMRCMMCDPEFYSSLADPFQKDLLKIFRAWELQMKQLKRTGESLRSCGWKDIAMLMQNDTFFTTFTRTELEPPVKNALCDLWLNLEQEHIASHRMEDTSTSYTHATTTIPPVAATSPKSSGPGSGNGWLERALAQETFHSKDGVLSQYICHTEHGSCLKLTTPGEIGFEVAKIELYPFTEVVNEDRLNWWRAARTRALVHFNSPLDPDLQTIKRILDRKAQQISEMEGTEKKVTRVASDKPERKGPTRGNKS